MNQTETREKPPFEFFVDAIKYEANDASMTGAQIKAIAKVTPTYQLYEEEEGNTPDKPISDSQAVDLAGKIKHFYAVPPATFGLA
jgi:hypothetical protein